VGSVQQRHTRSLALTWRTWHRACRDRRDWRRNVLRRSRNNFLEPSMFEFDGVWEWLTALFGDWDTVIWGN